MKNEKPYLSVETLTEIIKVLIKDEIVATYTEEETAINVHLINGQNFRIIVEEV